MNKSFVAVAALGWAAGVALAADSKMPLGPLQEKAGSPSNLVAKKAAGAPVRGGIYEVQGQLQAVEAASAAGRPVLARLGGKAVVQSAAPLAGAGSSGASAAKGFIVPGTVVKNKLTGEYGYYSGHVLVLLKDPRQLPALQQRFGLSLVKAGGDNALTLLQAPAGTDLKKLKTDITASGLARDVRLDLVDKRYSTQ